MDKRAHIDRTFGHDLQNGPKIAQGQAMLTERPFLLIWVLVPVAVTRMAFPCTEAVQRHFRIAATADLHKGPADRRQKVTSGSLIPEVVQHSAVKLAGKGDHRGIRRAAEGLRPAPVTDANGAEQSFLDRVLRDQGKAEGIRERTRDRGLSSSGQAGHNDEEAHAVSQAVGPSGVATRPGCPRGCLAAGVAARKDQKSTRLIHIDPVDLPKLHRVIVGRVGLEPTTGGL